MPEIRDSSTNLSNVTQAHEVPSNQEFYLIGIGGAGMSVLALLLHDLGYHVSGSDQVQADTLGQLREAGITIFVGHREEQVPANAIVVVTSAVHEDNPEAARAQALGLEIWHRSQALDFCTRSHDLVAVAGAHGKTSTSSMIAHALLKIGANPSFAIGGVIAELDTGARLGSGSAFVIEADESDGSFLNYSPAVEVITNIEPDHLDHWGSAAAFEQAFVDFTGRLREGGALVLCADDAGVKRLAAQVLAQRDDGGPRVISYGFGVPLAGDVVVQLSEPELGPGQGHCQVSVTDAGQQVFHGQLKLRIGGQHMLLNAGGALGAAYALGVDLPQFITALGTFSGASRRMQRVGERDGVRIYDDYGHHPTEIAATLQAARDLAGSGRLLVCFQPHLYSRTYHNVDAFAQVFAAVDDLTVCSVYAAREAPIPGVNGNIITERLNQGTYVADMYAAGLRAFHAARPGDLLLFLGAGSITHVGHAIAAGHDYASVEQAAQAKESQA
ncbi:UDP-N-acetylmuramate--L-alanine ligase [Mobiluncus sp.]|uniref:UDP-N-acetylmuramate--L-alanine ligase n=1 Tax=Mobiluncus sp. TaxID=47293 RepID=UPI002A90A146|nr:UDP-N-acetylmuramate--L-alanine ligase [Mobiluncus sp.]MDY6076300.1 UDP-N-acetylmuramate--L-alanine ligase [Mobiluncus sp.]